MRVLTSVSMFVLLGGALAACGGSDTKVTPDARQLGDAPIDTPPPPPGCDYGELHDDTNDSVTVMTGQAEATGLSFTSSLVLCGKIQASHLDAASMTVDADAYAFNVAQDAQVTVTLTGAGAEALDNVTLLVEDDGNTSYSGLFATNHAITNADLPAGNYRVIVIAGNPTAPAADIAYKVKIATDDPAMRCTKATAAATYTEAHDGANSAGNDMVEVRYQSDPRRALTAATDAAEPSGVVATPGMKYRISGTSANVDAADEYHDRDTFLFTTGATTTRMSVRLNWPSMMADLDFYVFPVGTPSEIATGSVIGLKEDEFATFAVKPNTQYWLWIGSYDDPMGVWPASYDATLCPEAFTP